MKAIAFALFLVVTSAAQIAHAEVVTATLFCPSGKKITKEISCEPGETVTATGMCPGGKVVTQKMMCPEIPYPVANWGVGGTTYYLNAAKGGGPAALGVEAEVSLHLRVARDILDFSLLFGPGGAWSGERSYWSLTEAALLDFHLTKAFSLSLIGRHRATFDAEGGSINAVSGGIALGYAFNFGLDLKIGGGVGSAWFPLVEDTSSYNEASKETTITSETLTGSGLAYDVFFSLGWRFW